MLVYFLWNGCHLVDQKSCEAIQPSHHMDINFWRKLENDTLFDNLDEENENCLCIFLSVSFSDLFLWASEWQSKGINQPVETILCLYFYVLIFIDQKYEQFFKKQRKISGTLELSHLCDGVNPVNKKLFDQMVGQ